MRKCLRCDTVMKEDYRVSVQGANYGIVVTQPGFFQKTVGKVRVVVCPNCGYLEFYLEDTDKIK